MATRPDAQSSEFLRLFDPYCALLAAEIREKAVDSVRRRDAELRREGDPDLWAKLLLRWGWWRSRIEAAEALAAAAETCGETLAVFCCGWCGQRWTAPRRCGQPMLCEACRGRTIKRRRAELAEALVDALERAPRDYSLRLITLTTPQLLRQTDELGDQHVVRPLETRERLALARKVRARWFRFLREREEQGRSFWAATLEVESARDGKGHPHWHALIVSRFVPDTVGAAWLGEAVRRSGVEPLWRPFGVAIERMWDRLEDVPARLSTRYAERERRDLHALARIWWTRPGETPPRRRKWETRIAYAERRVEWARGGKRCTLRQVSAWQRVSPDELERFAELPHGDFDARRTRADSAVAELVKYMTKDLEMPPALRALVAYEVKSAGMRTYVTSRSLIEPSCGEGCPHCGSDRVRIETPKPDWRERMGEVAGILARAPP